MMLRNAYGGRYLLAVICYNHVLKGFVLMYAYTSLDFVLRSFHVGGPQMQVYKSVALLPWVLKPLLGIISDSLPICGYRKNPYIVAATFIGMPSFLLVGLCGQALGLEATVAAFFGMSVQISACDLLADAATAERLRQVPGQGPAMMAFVSGGTTVADIVATATVGSVLQRLGPRGPALLCSVPSGLMLLPALTNCLGERRRSQEETRKMRSSLSMQVEVLMLVAVVAVGSLTLVIACATQLNLFTKLMTVGGVAAGVVGAFTALLNPTIGLMNAFFFLQSSSAISVEGGSFYFFTDDPTSFPLGPHFSVWFYTTGLGLAGNACGLLGLWAYGRYMTRWRYRSIFALSNTLWCIVSIVNALVFTRRNLQLGIPDHTFVLGGTVLQNIFERWTYVPGGVLLSQLCPQGMEATMFALLAGCHNLGRSVASYLGSFMLTYLQVSPSGLPHEELQFTRLWQAAACQALAPLLTLWLLPRMIPDAVQTDRILGPDSGAAVSGSPLSQLGAALTRGGGMRRRICTTWGLFQRAQEASVQEGGTGVAYGATRSGEGSSDTGGSGAASVKAEA